MNAGTIADLVQSVTKTWTKQRKAEEREFRARARRSAALVPSYRETIKDAAWAVMEKAYLHASSGGKLPALARQIMYAARGEIQARTGCQLDDHYFTQDLLPNYIDKHPQAQNWDVVFDARGHFYEPHTEHEVPLGTLHVRQYISEIRERLGPISPVGHALQVNRQYPTKGPACRFKTLLFIEKEGFMPLFQQVQLAERYDLAIMSTKGMSVTASRHLIDELSALHGELTVLVLHDFDKAGFSIIGTLRRDTRRYSYRHRVRIIDLGLRLEDVEAYDLEPEDTTYKSNPTWNLRKNGATEEEIEFLYGGDFGCGQRVELNAFSSGDFIEWIEKGLKKHGVEKLIPPPESLEQLYRRALEIEILNSKIQRLAVGCYRRAQLGGVPRDLRLKIEKRLRANPAEAWDSVLADIAHKGLKRSKSQEPGSEQQGSEPSGKTPSEEVR